MDLPSISQVHTHGPAHIAWYNYHAAEQPLLSGDELPTADCYPGPVADPRFTTHIRGGECEQFQRLL